MGAARKRIVVVGAGGFAREVAYLIRVLEGSGEGVQFAKFFTRDLANPGAYDETSDVVDAAWLDANCDAFDGFAFGIGTPASKTRIHAELTAKFPGKVFPPLVHPNARFDRASSNIGDGVVICDGVVGTVNLRFERLAMVNLCCTLGHEAVVGEAAVLNPTVNVSGGVVIEREVLIGTGAQVLQYLRVGAGATIGAGACVTRDVAPGTTVVGVPAKARPSNV